MCTLLLKSILRWHCFHCRTMCAPSERPINLNNLVNRSRSRSRTVWTGLYSIANFLNNGIFWLWPASDVWIAEHFYILYQLSDTKLIKFTQRIHFWRHSNIFRIKLEDQCVYFYNSYVCLQLSKWSLSRRKYLGNTLMATGFDNVWWHFRCTIITTEWYYHILKSYFKLNNTKNSSSLPSLNTKIINTLVKVWSKIAGMRTANPLTLYYL